MQRERRKNNDILFHFRKDGLPMTKLSQLKIDPEFQNQINPPSFEETHQLEMNILKEERVLNPIITWNGYIVDPADFKGHSLSVSDVVVLHQNGQDTAHYCDSVGFQQVPEFLREKPLRTTKLSTEQNENMIDGVLNNAPSLGELEAKAKAGEQISLTDLAAAVKTEEKTPKAKKSRAAKSKKPSIRAQLDAAKKEQSKQPPPREKTKELEV